MQMTPRIKLIGGGVLGVLVVGWFALSQYAAGRAEAHIDAALGRHGVRDQVHWETVSASPFGGRVTLADVRVDGALAGESMRIDTVRIDDFVDATERKRAVLHFGGIRLESGHSPLGSIEAVRATGRHDFPPASATVRWDLDLDDDTLELSIELAQPALMNASVTLELERVARMLGALEEAGSGARPGRFDGPGAGMRPDNPLQALGSVFGLMSLAGEVRLRQASASVHDDGYIARSIALHKRYGIVVSHDGGSPADQREAAFEQTVAEARRQCAADLPLSDRDAREDACETLIDFASGERKSVRLTLEPQRPLPLGELLELMMKDPARAVPLLRPAVDS
jgi:hypothetical protein